MSRKSIVNTTYIHVNAWNQKVQKFLLAHSPASHSTTVVVAADVDVVEAPMVVEVPNTDLAA